jgi:hypothetical protein
MSLKARSKLLNTMLLAVSLVGGSVSTAMEVTRPLRWQTSNSKSSSQPSQTDSLCSKSEHIIFSCRLKGSGKASAARAAKIVSLCASADLDSEHGYLQYRFGLPNRIELEFPKSREGTQQKFTYTHYFRFQVDLTEISFNIDDYEYSILDDYNGEEKPAIILQGVSVKAPGRAQDSMLTCRNKPKADFSTIGDVLKRDQD